MFPVDRRALVAWVAAAGMWSGLSAGELSLEDAIARALEHNLDIRLSEVAVGRAEDGIDIAKAEFDPSLVFNAGLGESRSPQNSSTLEGASQPFSESWDTSASVRQAIPFGTSFRLGAGIDRRETNSTISAFNPEYNSDLFLSIEQPLLRGMGRKLNLAPRRLAESSARQSRIDLKARTLDVLRDVELSYWQLAFERTRRDLRQSSIDAAEKLLAETEERERIGVATKVDVLQARAALASRQEAVILADQAIARARDELAEIVGLRALADAGFRLEPLPDGVPGPPERALFMSAAMSFDLNRRAQLEVIRRSRLELERARQLRWPQLNLRVDGSYLGRDTAGSDAYQGALDREGYSWSGGLELSLPWGFREAKARERQARRDLRAAELNEARIEQSLFYELRGAWRDSETGGKRLAVAGVAVDLQAEQFAEEEARYSAGLVTLREVLEAQEDFDAARLSFLDALIDSLQAQVVLGRLDGTLMDRHRLTW
jgi:outer membrane protein TolC